MAKNRTVMRGPRKMTPTRAILLSLYILIAIGIIVVICLFAFGVIGSSQKRYDVEFVLNGGITDEGMSSIDTMNVQSLDISEVPEILKDGWAFGGWYLDAELSEAVSWPLKPTKNVKLYARWGYNIIFNTNTVDANGKVVQGALVETSISSDQLPSMTNDGFDFEGWFTTPDFSGLQVDFPCVLTSNNVRLYAKWSPKAGTNAKNVTINTGKDHFNLNVKAGTKITAMPTTEQRDGFTFWGYGKISKVEGSNKSAYIYDANQQYTSVTSLAGFEQNDFGFDLVTFPYTVSEDSAEIVAVWGRESAGASKWSDMTIDFNNRDDMAKYPEDHDKQLPSPSEIYDETNLEGIHWIQYQFTAYFDGDYETGGVWVTISRTVALYDRGDTDMSIFTDFYQSVPDVTGEVISFDPDDSEPKIIHDWSAIECELALTWRYGTMHNYSADFATFLAGEKNDACGQSVQKIFTDMKYAGNGYNASTLDSYFDYYHAEFTAILGGEQVFVVKYDSNGGSDIPDMVGQVIPQLPTPSKEGFSAAGWYTADDMLFSRPVTTHIDAKMRNIVVQADSKLYARWIMPTGVTEEYFNVAIVNGFGNKDIYSLRQYYKGTKITEADILATGDGATRAGYSYVVVEINSVNFADDSEITSMTKVSFPYEVKKNAVLGVIWYRNTTKTLANLIDEGVVPPVWGAGSGSESKYMEYSNGASLISKNTQWSDIFNSTTFNVVDIISYTAILDFASNPESPVDQTQKILALYAYKSTYMIFDKGQVSAAGVLDNWFSDATYYGDVDISYAKATSGDSANIQRSAFTSDFIWREVSIVATNDGTSGSMYYFGSSYKQLASIINNSSAVPSINFATQGYMVVNDCYHVPYTSSQSTYLTWESQGLLARTALDLPIPTSATIFPYFNGWYYASNLDESMQLSVFSEFYNRGGLWMDSNLTIFPSYGPNPWYIENMSWGS